MVKGIIKVDMRGVGEGGGARVEPGDYIVKAKKVAPKTSEKQKPYLEFTLAIAKGSSKGTIILDRCSLQSQALWRLRNVMQAMGTKVPEKVIKIKLKTLLGKEFGVTLDDEEYKGSTRSIVVDVFAPKLAKKKKAKKGKKAKRGKKAKKSRDEDADDEDVDDEEEDVDDEEEDEEEDEDDGDEDDEDEDEDDEDEDDEDEDEEDDELEELEEL